MSHRSETCKSSFCGCVNMRKKHRPTICKKCGKIFCLDCEFILGEMNAKDLKSKGKQIRKGY